MKGLHFISGLPRSGSTLLAALLNQNPAFHAAMSSPVFGIFNAALGAMGGSNEYAMFLTEAQRSRILQGIFTGYYSDICDAAAGGNVCFDTNRMWTARLPALVKLSPGVRVICCIRNPAWIADSIEVLLGRNALDTTRLFGGDRERQSVYSRCAALLSNGRLIGGPLRALKEAYHGAHADHLLLLDYDILVRQPKDAMALVYAFLGEPVFEHDFTSVTYQAETFDAQVMVRDLHRVAGPVRPRDRKTVLPPDLFEDLSGLAFWQRETSSAYRIVAANHCMPP